MRLLHTADWHLGSRLDVHDRTEEFFNQVEQVCEIAAQNRVDVLLVAGDIFERRSKLPEVTKRLAEILSPHVRRRMHVILVPGNHDDREHFRMMHALLALEQGQSERVHIIQTRAMIAIDGVQFGIIPYPTPELLEPYRMEVTGATQRHIALSSAFANLVRAVVAAFDPALPAVFVSHINVSGVTTPNQRELTYDEDLRLGTQDLPDAPNLAYIALGHIHQYKELEHTIPCCYSGSIDRMNLGEMKDEKRVLLVDIPQRGHAQVTEVPLASTPFYDLHVTASELETLPSRYPDLERAFVHIQLECQAGDDPMSCNAERVSFAHVVWMCI